MRDAVSLIGRLQALSVRRADPFEKGYEARLSLTRTGFQHLLPRLGAAGAKTTRTDLYFEAWSGKQLLLEKGERPWKVRLMHHPDGGSKAYELSISTARPVSTGDHGLTLAAGEKTTLKLPASEGEKLFRASKALLRALRAGQQVPEPTARQLDHTLREALRRAHLRREVLGDLEDESFLLVPVDLNTKERIKSTFDGGKRVGKVSVMLGRTLDVDPQSGQARTRYELEAEPGDTASLDRRKLIQALSKQLGLGALDTIDEGGTLPKSELIALAKWNDQTWRPGSRPQRAAAAAMPAA